MNWEWIIALLQLLNVAVNAPSVQPSVIYGENNVVIYAAGETPNHAPLYIKRGEETTLLGGDTWGGHYATNSDCSLVIYAPVTETSSQITLGLPVIEVFDLTAHSQMTWFLPSPRDSEAFMFPSFLYGSNDFAVVVASPEKRSLMVVNGTYATVVLERNHSYYLDAIRWGERDYVAVRIRANLGMADPAYVLVHIPSGVENVITEEEYFAIPTVEKLPQELEPTLDTVYAYACDTRSTN